MLRLLLSERAVCAARSGGVQRGTFYCACLSLCGEHISTKQNKNMFNQQNRALYTRKEIAALLGVGSLTIAAWEKQGCPAVYIGKLTNGKGSRPRYDLEKVKAWLENRTAAGADDKQKGGAA